MTKASIVQADSSPSIDREGFEISNHIYNLEEQKAILNLLKDPSTQETNTRRSSEVYAIRQVLKEIPELASILLNQTLLTKIESILGKGFFVVKSIYFDKPAVSNWFVPYHQDLTISVKDRVAVPGFKHFTKKHDQYAVQPPVSILENILTVRIHLDDTTKYNGALYVIPNSHIKGIYRPEHIDWTKEKECCCEVEAGGILLMKPMILHRSERTTNQQQRRVIHLEFSTINLPDALKWSEQLKLN